MSSTNRGGIRQTSDYYVTPVREILKVLGELVILIPKLFIKRAKNKEARIFFRKDVTVLDPCAGGDNTHEMSYPKALELFGIQKSNITTVDIRGDSKAGFIGNYFDLSFKDKFDLIITNPPFSHALPIIKKAFSETKPGGYVVMLLRLNFFGSIGRFPFWQEHLPLYCFVHHKRMSFTAKRGTDSIEYMHCVWQVGNKVEFTQLKVI